MRRLDAGIGLVVAALLLCALTVVSLSAIQTGGSLVLPELRAEAAAVAATLADLTRSALGYGIPLQDLRGVDAVLVEALERHPDISYAALTATDGAVLSSVGGSIPSETVSVAFAGPNGPAGFVVLGTQPDLAARLVRELWIDGAVLLFAAALLALELSAFAFTFPAAARFRALSRATSAVAAGDLRLPSTTVPGAKPEHDVAAAVIAARARQNALLEDAVREGNEAAIAKLEALDNKHGLSSFRHRTPVSIAAVRAPTFVFFLAEEITRPFLPQTIAALAPEDWPISPSFIVALPIVVFMAIVALGQPWLNGWTERIGRSRALRLGAAIAAAGYVGTAFAESFVVLTLARAATAVGFATTFVAAQGYIVDRTGSTNKARGIGSFVTAIMAAMLCGPPIGGLMASQFDPRAGFLLAALAAALSVLLANAVLPNYDRKPDKSTVHAPRVALRDVWRALTSPRLSALILGCALPAKVALIGLCFYVMPLALSAEGFTPDVVGRVLMLYGLMMLVVVPYTSSLSDRKSRRTIFVVAGGVMTACAILAWFILPQPWGAAAMVALIGFAQGISTTPQSALVTELGAKALPHLSQGGILSVFRLVERSGTALGPLMIAALWSAFSLEGALVGVAVLMLGGSAALVLTSRAGSQKGESR